MHGRRDLELQDEIDTHLALAEEEYRRAGMSDDEARDAARRAFGGVLKTGRCIASSTAGAGSTG